MAGSVSKENMFLECAFWKLEFALIPKFLVMQNVLECAKELFLAEANNTWEKTF